MADSGPQHLMTCMKTQKAQIASMQDAFLNKKCAELNVPESQKLALKEIIAAVSKKDIRGRRYTKEWVMLCMLMNIRSVGYYEFMRKNNILPFPCTRTIRSYFSLINAKCGFDEHFAKLLEKHFASKTPLQRHGVLLLDEINLRKSVAVSKNLTYVGLTDLGDDGQQSTDINEQATHGLVKDHPGNARVCPKITNGHIVLDNTSKMRVRLATQVCLFINSKVKNFLLSKIS
ncbi:hypothetical protein ACS0PU_012025 [Formica fusca]